MRVTLALILLCAAKVQCFNEGLDCARKEFPPGVLSVPLGSEIILGCRGDVTLDGVPLVVAVKPKERLRMREASAGHWTSQKARENPAVFGTYHPETRGTAVHQNMVPNGIRATVKPSVNAYPPAMKTTQSFHQPTRSNRVDTVVEEGGAFGVTMEMGIRSEVSREFGENYDYEENEDGLRVTRSIRRQAHWTKNGHTIRGGVEKGGALRIPTLRLVNSGNYSCFRADRLVSSVIISVSVAPETPSLSCHRKSHTSKIRCEWISKQPILPRPQCYLLLRKGLERFTRMNCSYSPERLRCWCAFSSEENDSHRYDAKLCVTNTAGSAISPPFSYIPLDIIKPDPPTQVVVKPVQGEPHTLSVTWSYPATWKGNGFYILHFHLRYRPQHSTEYQQKYIESMEPSWLISDALPLTQYEIQLQAKDNFDGQWSAWTSSVFGHTWTAPAEPTIALDIYTSLDPFWPFYEEGSGGVQENLDVVMRPADDGIGVKCMWVVGLCLLITVTITMVSVYCVRNSMPFIFKKNKPSISPPYSCSIPVAPPLLVAPPQQQSQHYFLSEQEEEREAIHIHNVDYFFPSYGLDMSDS